MLLYRSLRPGTAQSAFVLLGSPHQYHGYTVDPLAPVDGFSLVLKSWDIAGQFGFDPVDVNASHLDYLYSDSPPATDKEALGPLIFHQKWWAAIRTWRALFKDWKFARAPYYVPGENPTLHRNIIGIAESGEFPSQSFYKAYDDEGKYFPCVFNTLYRVFTVVDDNPETPVISTGVTSGSHNGPLFGSVVEYINSKIRNGDFDVVDDGFLYYHFPLSLSHTQTTSTVVLCIVQAEREVGNDWQGWLNYYQISISVNQVTSPPYVVGVPGLIEDIQNYDVLYGVSEPFSGSFAISEAPPSRHFFEDSFGLASSSGILPSASPSWFELEFSDGGGRLHFIRPPLQRPKFHEYVGYDATTQVFVKGSSVGYLTFMDEMTERLPGFIVGTFESSQDALDKEFGGLDSNYIETIAELNSILDPIDILKGIKVFLSNNFRGGLVEFLKLLANANLAYQFGIAPSISDAENLRKNLGNVINRLRSGQLLKAKTLYGKSVYPGLDHGGYFKPFTVECRSKIVLQPNADSLLPFILPLKALGVLPSMSNIWDLVPYSWLIDDFVNVGKALELVDSSLFQLVLDIDYSVHSVSVLFNIGDGCEDCGFSAVAGSLPAYKLYNRFTINESLPMLGPTTLPLFGTTLSGFDIYASLIVTRL